MDENFESRKNDEHFIVLSYSLYYYHIIISLCTVIILFIDVIVIVESLLNR